MSITDADIQAAIATVGPLFDTPNAATGETGAEAAQAIEEAVAAVEGQSAEPEPDAPAEEAAPPKEDPVTKRMAMVAREKARVESERAKIRAEREALERDRQEREQERREFQEYKQRKAKAADDPFGFLKLEAGVDFEDAARKWLANAEPPKEPDPLDEARQVRAQLDELREELRRREMQQSYETAAREIRSRLSAQLDEFPALKVAINNPDVRQTMRDMGAGDPEQNVIDTIATAWREGLQVEIDGKVYTWPRGTDLSVDVAARIVDNGVMQLARRFAAVTGSQAMPTSQPKVAAAAETSTPGKSATRPRTLSNTRATTPTSPLRESRSYASDEEELRDLARQFDVWAEK